MNHFLICMVWNVAMLTGGGDTDRPLQSDSTDRLNRIEVRYGEEGGTFEYRHSWIPMLSTDLYLSTNVLRGIGAGISFDPISLLSFQGSFGFPVGSDQPTDGPVFDPEYTYGVRGAVLIPLNLLQSRLYVSLSGGKVWIVDKNYSAGGGLLPPYGNDVVVPVTASKETRTMEFFEIGLGIRF
jgi:hypothetical protein